MKYIIALCLVFSFMLIIFGLMKSAAASDKHTEYLLDFMDLKDKNICRGPKIVKAFWK